MKASRAGFVSLFCLVIYVATSGIFYACCCIGTLKTLWKEHAAESKAEFVLFCGEYIKSGIGEAVHLKHLRIWCQMHLYKTTMQTYTYFKYFSLR